MKQLYIISFLLFLIGFYGCYDDEGNYDYTCLLYTSDAADE